MFCKKVFISTHIRQHIDWYWYICDRPVSACWLIYQSGSKCHQKHTTISKQKSSWIKIRALITLMMMMMCLWGSCLSWWRPGGSLFGSGRIWRRRRQRTLRCPATKPETPSGRVICCSPHASATNTLPWTTVCRYAHTGRRHRAQGHVTSDLFMSSEILCML